MSEYKKSYDGGLKPNFERCAAETVAGTSMPSRQCRFRRGFGPDMAYCKRHAELKEKENA